MIRIVLAAAMLAAVFGSAQAKPTFNDVRAACHARIDDFLGETPWKDHAYRVTLLEVVDYGRFLDVTIVHDPSSAGEDTPSGRVAFIGNEPLRHVRAAVRTRLPGYVHFVDYSFIENGFYAWTRPELEKHKSRFLGLLYFNGRKAWDAPVWYVFRRLFDASPLGAVQLFSVDTYGNCVDAPYYDFIIAQTPFGDTIGD